MSNEFTGEGERLICYGYDELGGEAPCYFRRCEKCLAFAKLPDTLNVGRDAPAPDCPVVCYRCGPSGALWAGWAGDCAALLDGGDGDE